MANWYWEFVDSGGYDSMTDAIYIYNGYQHRITLDMSKWGQTRSWDGAPTYLSEAEDVAERIVKMLNAR